MVSMRAIVFAIILATAAWPRASTHAAQPQGPRGRFVQGVFESIAIFPGTRREWSVYVPAEYTGAEPARLMVFQDGPAYAKADGPYRVPLVFDELIAKREMPVTVALFVTPGTIPAVRPDAKDRSNRSFEYDSLGDRYARFLVEELLPVALDGLKISTDPRDRAICGQSSGGICAFTAAWERPDQFGRVMSHIGSFADIRGGYAYPVLVRTSKSAPKPIKVYLQDGRDDLDNLFGSWPLGNADMAAALAFAGYDHRFELTDGGHNGKAAGAIFADGLRWLWSEAPVQPATPPAAEKPGKWEPHPLAVAKAAVPKGRVERMPPFESKVFPGTIREWAIYVPAQAKPDVPAALMVFQDGHDYAKPEGRWRVPIVFDNLIAAGTMPPTVAVFVDPGHEQAKEKPPSPWKNSNRSLEYDSLGDRYARFLLEEILPEVAKKQPLTADPGLRAICGASSGGICSFTVAWERPDSFGRVLSTIGSFTGLRGGNAYPSLIRKTEPKPIRVYLADTSGDNDNPFGSWPIANRQMAAALDFMGYDLRFDWAEGYAHDSFHASRLFPEALAWLWRDEKHVPSPPTRPDLPGDMSLRRLLVPGSDWEVVAGDLGFADAPCTDTDGNFYFCDMKAPAVYRIAALDGTRTTIAQEAVSGLEFGPDGRLYGCQGAKKRLIGIDPANGRVEEIAGDLAPNDLAILPDGTIYVTETGKQQVTRVDPKTGAKTAADTGITGPNGIALSNDSGTVAVSDYKGGHTWMFRVGADGTLDAKMPTMEMRRPIDPKGEFKFHEPPPLLAASGGDGMAVDWAGRWYVTSALGVQVFDPTGRLCGVIRKPRPDKPLTSCVLAGPKRDELYVTNGNAVYRRKLAVESPETVGQPKSDVRTATQAEPTNADEAAAKKQAEEVAVNEKYATLVATLSPAEQAWEKALQDNLGSFYLPIHKRDRVAGRSTAWDFVRDNPALPRVLLIGDSVSRGYTQAVRKELAGVANVHRAPANCGPTASGIKNIEAWLASAPGGEKWDVIHFNFGIHDRATPVADYTGRLEKIVERLQQTGAKLVWATTTPIPDVPDQKQTAASIVDRNAAAATVMEKHGVAIDDLFGFITPHLDEAQLPNDVHFKAEGYDLLGRQVAESIRAALGSTRAGS